ncbi:hypothetical protein BDZ89DRAFT_1064891 [Hymenopellis radicata]|nr:hypothetical protein BDZ89DRAFT_1064891 [Hymenopellis radicata]
MTDFCSTWRNHTSHPVIDFAACRCDGEDSAGFSAHKGCTDSAARVVGIIGPFIVIVAVVCWFRGVRRGLDDIFFWSVALLCAVPAVLYWLLYYSTRALKWSTAYGDVCLDWVIVHPLIQLLRLAIKRSSTPIAQQPILPRELCDIIIAFCEDQSSLLACSLVCVAWVPASRRELHIELRFTSHERTIRLGRLLRSPLETLSPWLDCTGIEFGGKRYRQQWRLLYLLKLKGFQPQRATIWRRGRLTPHLLHIYPDLQSLTFHVAPCNDTDMWLQQADELCMFLTTVLGFKHLRSLTIEINPEHVDMFLSFIPSNYHLNTSETLPVSRLSLGGRWINSLLIWLQSRCHMLETLDIHTIAGWSTGGSSAVFLLESLMRTNWQTLKHLHLVVSSFDAPLNLSSLKHLISIHLFLELEAQTSGSVDCAMKTLQMLDSSHRLKELRLLSSTLNFTDSHAATFDEIILGTLGLMPVTKESNLHSYVGTAER